MEFKASLASEHFKALSSTLDAFSHLGEIVSIEIHNEQFVFSTINSSRTAQAIAYISRDQFSKYVLLRNGSPDRILRCTVSNKNFNSIFKKNLNATKLIKECQIHITQGNSDSEQHTESRLYMKLIYENRVTKKNTLWYFDGDPITAYYQSQYANHLICHPLLLKGYLSRFDPRIKELALVCTPTRVILQSHWDTSTSNTGDLPVRTTFAIASSDFDSYSIQKPVKLICNLREFKAIVDYMEAVDAKVNLSFEDMGMPIVNKLFIQDQLLVNIALQTQPRHLYDNQSTAEDSSYISINTNGILNLDYSELPSRSHHQQSSNTASNRRESNNHLQSASPTSSKQQSNRHGSHHTPYVATPSPIRPNDNNSQQHSASNHGSQNSSISQFYRSNDEEASTAAPNNLTLSPNSLHDTLPYVSPVASRQVNLSRSETSSDLDEEPLFTRQHIIDRRKSQHLNSSHGSSSDDHGKSSAERAKTQRLTTLEKLRLKKQQQKLQHQ